MVSIDWRSTGFCSLRRLNMTIRAILFDFDDTLGNRNYYAYEMYRDLVVKYGDVKDPVELEGIVQDCMLADQLGNCNKCYISDMLKNRYGITLPFEDFNRWWGDNQWRYVVLFEDARGVLEKLSRKYMLACVTNGSEQGQYRKLERMELLPYFREIIISGAVGAAKPDGRIFACALERLGVKPEEAVFVGDTFSKDIIGAYRAGMTSIWVCHDSTKQCMAPIKRISSLSELLELY
jgi:putative hydrolase of the HAD superfamily